MNSQVLERHYRSLDHADNGGEQSVLSDILVVQTLGPQDAY